MNKQPIDWDYIIRGLIDRYTDDVLKTIDYEALGEEIIKIYKENYE